MRGDITRKTLVNESKRGNGKTCKFFTNEQKNATIKQSIKQYLIAMMNEFN